MNSVHGNFFLVINSPRNFKNAKMRLNTVFFSITQNYVIAIRIKNWYNRHIKVRNLFRRTKNVQQLHFDLYGTLIDINTDEWNDDLWKKIAILYAYKGAHYTYDELNEEYDRLVQAEKRLFSKSLLTQKLLTSKLKRFSASFSHRKVLRLQKPRYFYCRGIPLLLNKVHQAL